MESVSPEDIVTGDAEKELTEDSSTNGSIVIENDAAPCDGSPAGDSQPTGNESSVVDGADLNAGDVDGDSTTRDERGQIDQHRLAKSTSYAGAQPGKDALTEEEDCSNHRLGVNAIAATLVRLDQKYKFRNRMERTWSNVTYSVEKHKASIICGQAMLISALFCWNILLTHKQNQIIDQIELLESPGLQQIVSTSVRDSIVRMIALRR